MRRLPLVPCPKHPAEQWDSNQRLRDCIADFDARTPQPGEAYTRLADGSLQWVPLGTSAIVAGVPVVDVQWEPLTALPGLPTGTLRARQHGRRLVLSVPDPLAPAYPAWSVTFVPPTPDLEHDQLRALVGAVRERAAR